MSGKYFGGPEAQNQAHFCWRWKNLPSYLVLCFLGVRYWTWAVSFCQNKPQTSRLSVSEISVWPFNHQFISLIPPACRITVEFACYSDFYALHYPRKGNHYWKMFPLKEFSNLGQHDRWTKTYYICLPCCTIWAKNTAFWRYYKPLHCHRITWHSMIRVFYIFFLVFFPFLTKLIFQSDYCLALKSPQFGPSWLCFIYPSVSSWIDEEALRHWLRLVIMFKPPVKKKHLEKLKLLVKINAWLPLADDLIYR